MIDVLMESFSNLSQKTGSFVVYCYHDTQCVRFDTEVKSAHEKMRMKVFEQEISLLAHHLYHQISILLDQKSVIRVSNVNDITQVSIDNQILGLHSVLTSQYQRIQAVKARLDNITSFYTRYPDKKEQQAWRFMHTKLDLYASTPARAFLKRAIILAPDERLDESNLEDFLDRNINKSLMVRPALGDADQVFFPKIEDIMREIKES